MATSSPSIYRDLHEQSYDFNKTHNSLIQEAHLQLAKNNESEDIEIKELQSMLETLPDEEIDLDMDLDDAPEEIIGNLKVQMEQISKEMQEKQNFHDNLKREIERQHKAKKKSLMEKNMVAKTKPTPPTKMGGPLPPPSSLSQAGLSAKRGSPIQPEVSSFWFLTASYASLTVLGIAFHQLFVSSSQFVVHFSQVVKLYHLMSM